MPPCYRSSSVLIMGYRISLHFTACCDEDTLGVRELNLRMKNDAHVEYVLLNISDGVGIACKI